MNSTRYADSRLLSIPCSRTLFRTASLCRTLQQEDPICQSLARIADDCCYRDGAPWPPIPTALTPPPLTYILPKSNLIPAVMDARNTMRMPHPPSDQEPPIEVGNPFSPQWPSTITACGLLSHEFSDTQLRHWLLHHRCAAFSALSTAEKADASWFSFKKRIAGVSSGSMSTVYRSLLWPRRCGAGRFCGSGASRPETECRSTV